MQSSLKVISNETYTHKTVILDETRFEKCRFNDCIITYSGGPAEAYACQFSPNTAWRFEGPALMTMQVLQQCGWQFLTGKGEKPESFPHP
jgi:hypothetical protein